MFQEELPQYLAEMSDTEVDKLVVRLHNELASQCVILGHHYQKDEVIKHADYTGDSLKLAKAAASLKDTPYIVFCGVHFMAETADILTSDKQYVSLPDLNAGCDMADMAKAADVKTAWKDAESIGVKNIIPVTYVNSSAAVKALVGEHDGIVCTSGNAEKIVTWALSQTEHIFFFPDQHLGRNTAKRLGLDPVKDMLVWDPTKRLGGNSEEKIKSARIWLWKGHCPVHEEFTVEQVKSIRKSDPKMKIIVHPECFMEVCDLSDAIGSTEKIIETIDRSPKGSSWAIGTEKNLVDRLIKKYPDKKLICLNRYSCVCSTMNRISAKHLAWVLDDLKNDKGLRNIIKVDPTEAVLARRALVRMMELS